MRAAAARIPRDRLALMAGLALLTALAWAYTAYLAAGMGAMGDMSSMRTMGDVGSTMAMPSTRQWSAIDMALLAVMWIVMMIAMMVPSASPMILMFAGVQQRRRVQQRAAVPTVVFLLGYLLVWAGFSVLAAGLQWGLHRASLLSPMMVSASPVLGGGLLIAAGVFQWTPLKNACLSTCRSPLSFLTTRWRDGTLGALRMGIEHGAWCVGCCWLLMALLFVAGVMNLLWVAALAALVFVERLAPAGRVVSRIAGVGLVAWGSILIAGAGAG